MDGKPNHDSHEFAIRHFLGLPILMERWSVPAQYGGPGDWEWSRWRVCRFAHCVYVNAKLLEMRNDQAKAKGDTQAMHRAMRRLEEATQRALMAEVRAQKVIG